MSFLTPKLNRLHRLLTQIYPVKASTYFLVDSAGLSREKIEFSDRAVDNWYNILAQARTEGKLTAFLQFLKEHSNSPEFAQALEDYLKTPDWLGGGEPALEKVIKALLDKFRDHKRATLAVLVVLLLVIGGALAYYLFAPVTVAGYISCDGSSNRRGERLEAATVIVPGTNHKAVTDAQGHFTLQVPASLKFDVLEVLYGIDKVQVPRAQLKLPDHQVVPCRSETSPKFINIPFQWWQETKDEEAVITCKLPDGMRQRKLYTLKPDGPIQKNISASDLYVNVTLLGGWKFINAEVTRPRAEEEPWAETLNEADRRQWFFEMPGDRLDIGIQICLVTESETSRLSDTALVSNYFFK